MFEEIRVELKCHSISGTYMVFSEGMYFTWTLNAGNNLPAETVVRSNI